MKIIILQHIACETPGYIKDLMIRDQIDFTTIQLDEGDKIPNDLSVFDGMLCMGGPMGHMDGKGLSLVNRRKNCN